ncbi:GNAT family N-acetyltransferase [Vibrio sp. HN007]|uniref:GNAT family N-acetyltransferase n=1 Tax=Vibrio iocasae TaxID=3098914 RepID=UPI0035D4E8CC
MKAPVLETSRFTIRAFEKTDLSTFAEYRAQESVSRYQTWTDYSYEQALAFFERMDYTHFADNGLWFQLAIASKTSNELLGDVALHFIDNEQIEIGFTIAPKHQKQGVATEAVYAVLDYLFNTLNKHRVIATTDARNAASYQLLEKLRFRREAHFVQNIFFKGEWGDEYQYALLKTEFAK